MGLDKAVCGDAHPAVGGDPHAVKVSRQRYHTGQPSSYVLGATMQDVIYHRPVLSCHARDVHVCIVGPW